MEDEGKKYCEIIDDYLPFNHTYFKMRNEIEASESFMGLAIAEGVRVNEIREFLDMLDTLYSGISDREVRLDEFKEKRLKFTEEGWYDLKEKCNNGDKRAMYLFLSHFHIENAVNDLMDLKKDTRFSERIEDDTITYMGKLSEAIIREALGYVRI
ncbi:MAG: DUF1940 domain-containing protein [Thermoplasmata archaeon]